MGDARRLLDICKSVLQLVFDTGVIIPTVSVQVPQMSKVLFQFFRSSELSQVAELPRLVQVLLACLCGMVKEMEERSKNPQLKKTIKAINGTSLRSVYLQVQKNMIGGSRPSVTDFGILFDQLVHNGFCKVVQSKRLKPMDRPVALQSSIHCRF